MLLDEIKSLDQLIKTLQINFNDRTAIIQRYTGTDWENYLPTQFDITETSELQPTQLNQPTNKKYYKVYVNKNSLFELCLIFWYNNAISTIHDHPEKGCIMKIIKGELIENMFKNIGNKKCSFIQKNIITKNNIVNRCGNTILHQIINNTDLTVSLHLYFPPNFQQNIYEKI